MEARPASQAPGAAREHRGVNVRGAFGTGTTPASGAVGKEGSLPPWSRRAARSRGQPRLGLASPGTDTCFPCQPRAAGTRGSGPRPRAAAVAAPSSFMANAEHVRGSRGSGSARQPHRTRSIQSHAGRRARKSTSGAKDARAERRERGRSFRTSAQSCALRCRGALCRLGGESAVASRL